MNLVPINELEFVVYAIDVLTFVLLIWSLAIHELWTPSTLVVDTINSLLINEFLRNKNDANLPFVVTALLYASSASSVDTAFYNKYKDFSKKMILGDPRYFVADINCDIVINATYKGKLYPASLLTQETVDNEMRNNPEKALREYYNRFTQDGGVGQIIKRALIVRNSYTRPPVLCNDNNQRKFVFA